MRCREVIAEQWVRNTAFAVLLSQVFFVVAPARAGVDTDYQQVARELLAEMISYRTVKGQNQVNALHHKLVERMLAGGFDPADVHLIHTEPEVSALVVRYRGNGSGGSPVLLAAHSDVVDAVADEWSTDPYKLMEIDGYLHGRGSLDNKGPATALLVSFLRLRKEGFVPSRDFILLITGDEETTGRAAQTVVRDHRALVDAGYALSADGGGARYTSKGTRYYVQVAEKSYFDFAMTIRNPGGHSSRPKPENAIYDIADVIKGLQAYRFPARRTPSTLQFLRDNADLYEGEVGEAMRRYADNPDDEAAADVLFNVPELVGRTRTTCIPTMISGGHGRNAQPRSVELVINCRAYPDEPVKLIRERLKNAAGGGGVEFKEYYVSPPNSSSEMIPEVMDALAEVIEDRFGEIKITPEMSPGASDAIFFRGAGIPTLGISGYAFQSGDARRHGKDERQSIESFHADLEHWYQLIRRLSDTRH